MPQPLDGMASDIGQLSERLRELERRVYVLEHQPEMQGRTHSASGVTELLKQPAHKTQRTSAARPTSQS